MNAGNKKKLICHWTYGNWVYGR